MGLIVSQRARSWNINTFEGHRHAPVAEAFQ
jgi:hypothetical protein